MLHILTNIHWSLCPNHIVSLQTIPFVSFTNVMHSSIPKTSNYLTLENALLFVTLHMYVCTHACIPHSWGLCPASTVMRAHSRWQTMVLRNGLVAAESLFADTVPEAGGTRQNDTNVPVFKDGLSDLIHFTPPFPKTHTSTLFPRTFLKFLSPNRSQGERREPAEQKRWNNL